MMGKNEVDFKLIHDTISLYFKGTYQGDAAQLEQAFHPEARISGIINGQMHNWSLTEFITRVTVSPTAENRGEVYDKKILLVDKTHHAAMVKARVVVGDLIFVDYLTLLKINGAWIIRNKSFTVYDAPNL